MAGIFRKITAWTLVAQTRNISFIEIDTLLVGRISLFFSIQQISVVYRATVDLFSKETQSMSVLYEKVYAMRLHRDVLPLLRKHSKVGPMLFCCLATI
jgi:hypothetical protein